nr:MAG TPA: hypothetical protein [Caudoviricetes sp.]
MIITGHIIQRVLAVCVARGSKALVSVLIH